MIALEHLCKSFGSTLAVNDVTLNIKDGEVFGLVGTNGAGKSTLLRLVTGILSQESGSILVDDMPVFDNPEVKQKIFFIPDDAYFFPGSTSAVMCEYYRSIYPDFDKERFDHLTEGFRLDTKKKISEFSKGMKKQLMVILGICSGARYLLCDETFDGLDPVMRQGVKSLMAQDMSDRGLVPVIASHNLRELEDICDHVGLLHQGGVLLSEDLADMKLGLQKVQVVFNSDEDREEATKDLNILLEEQRGRLYTYTVRGERSYVESHFRSVNPLFFEVLKLSLEEIFISETEVVGYDIRKFILG